MIENLKNNLDRFCLGLKFMVKNSWKSNTNSFIESLNQFLLLKGNSSDFKNDLTYSELTRLISQNAESVNNLLDFINSVLTFITLLQLKIQSQSISIFDNAKLENGTVTEINEETMSDVFLLSSPPEIIDTIENSYKYLYQLGYMKYEKGNNIYNTLMQLITFIKNEKLQFNQICATELPTDEFISIGGTKHGMIGIDEDLTEYCLPNASDYTIAEFNTDHSNIFHKIPSDNQLLGEGDIFGLHRQSIASHLSLDSGSEPLNNVANCDLSNVNNLPCDMNSNPNIYSISDNYSNVYAPRFSAFNRFLSYNENKSLDTSNQSMETQFGVLGSSNTLEVQKVPTVGNEGTSIGSDSGISDGHTIAQYELDNKFFGFENDIGFDKLQLSSDVTSYPISSQSQVSIGPHSFFGSTYNHPPDFDPMVSWPEAKYHSEIEPMSMEMDYNLNNNLDGNIMQSPFGYLKPYSEHKLRPRNNSRHIKTKGRRKSSSAAEGSNGSIVPRRDNTGRRRGSLSDVNNRNGQVTKANTHQSEARHRDRLSSTSAEDDGTLDIAKQRILFKWFLLHIYYPYPKTAEKVKLSQCTGLRVDQIENWFINARRRY